MRHPNMVDETRRGRELKELTLLLNARAKRLAQKSWTWREVQLRAAEMTSIKIVHARDGLRGQGRARITVKPPSPNEKFTCHVDYHEFNLNGAVPRYQLLSNAKPSMEISLGIPGVLDTVAGMLTAKFTVEFRCTAQRPGRYRFEVTPA